MQELIFTKRIIDRFENITFKEIEKFLIGSGKICPVALYNRLEESIKARIELEYEPIPKNVEELITIYGYDDFFKNDFMTKVKNHTEDNCPEI